MNTLEIDSVSLSFNRRKILTDIYLKCETGDIVGLIGRNGSGKSSLMKIIFGTLHAEHQSVRHENVLAVSNRQYVLTNGAMKEIDCRADLVAYGYLTA